MRTCAVLVGSCLEKDGSEDMDVEVEEDPEIGCDNEDSDNEKCEDREEGTNQLELDQGKGRKVSCEKLLKLNWLPTIYPLILGPGSGLTLVLGP